MNCRKHLQKLSCLALTLLSIEVSAQSFDTTKIESQIPNLEKKIAPKMGFYPYFFVPQPVRISLKQYSITPNNNDLIQKSQSTENAMRSIYYSLQNDKKMAESYKAYSFFATSVMLGGMVYQIVNAKHYAEDARKMREARTSPPPPRRR